MASVVTNEWVEKYNNYLGVFNTLSLHEKVFLYLQDMERYANQGRLLLDDKELKTIEEGNALSTFVETFFDEMSMLEDNDLPSKYPFELGEQELKDNYEVIFDCLREISSGFCDFLTEMERLGDKAQLTKTEFFQRMKAAFVIDRALILEIDELDDRD